MDIQNQVLGVGPGLGGKNRLRYFRVATAHTEWSRMIAEHVYSTLLRRDPQMNIVGDLAETWQMASDTTFVFRLRKGVTWHHGREDERHMLKVNAHPLAAGSVVHMQTGGGGGFGNPRERDPQRVRADVIDGFELEAVIPTEIASLAEDLARSPEPSPGAHCGEMYCPAVASCRAATTCSASADSGTRYSTPSRSCTAKSTWPPWACRYIVIVQPSGRVMTRTTTTILRVWDSRAMSARAGRKSRGARRAAVSALRSSATSAVSAAARFP